jgi:hypothetical protein
MPCVVAALPGCGQPSEFPEIRPAQTDSPESAASQPTAGGETDLPDSLPVADGKSSPGSDRSADSPDHGRIIYSGCVELIVEAAAFESIQTSLNSLVTRFSGYISDSEVVGSAGRKQSGSWTVRVPSLHFEAFVGEVASLGQLERSSTDSTDVSLEFTDLEARIRSKQVEETELFKLQQEAMARMAEEPKAKLADVLLVGERLQVVRTEIECMQGRLRFLSDRTVYSTVIVRVTTRDDYVPESAPGFRTELSRTFLGSFDRLAAVGRGIALIFVAVVPWLAAATVLFGPVWITLRRLRRRPG